MNRAVIRISTERVNEIHNNKSTSQVEIGKIRTATIPKMQTANKISKYLLERKTAVNRLFRSKGISNLPIFTYIPLINEELKRV